MGPAEDARLLLAFLREGYVIGVDVPAEGEIHALPMRM